jgi:uncharacterized protein
MALTMRIIRFSDLHETPWKNGGGISREVAIEGAGDDFVWRLSLADVAVDGLFSKFDGMQRVLTVIDGHGMELISSHSKLRADLYVPVRFDGAWEVMAKLKNGPLRDLNLIYDSERCIGDVQVMTSSRSLAASRDRMYALHCVEGVIVVNETDLHRGDTALFEHGRIETGQPVRALLITLDTFSGLSSGAV